MEGGGGGSAVSLRSFGFSVGGKLFLTHLVAVFLVSGSVGTFFYSQATDSLMRSLRSRLQNSAALVSHAVDSRTLADIRGPDDVGKPGYAEALGVLRRLRRSNPDIAFLYVMRKAGDRIEFVVDSDETDGQAMPGKEYQDVPPTMQQGFYAPSVDDQLYEDEWGVFLSGYAPLQDGEGEYLVGIDMDASEVSAKLRELRLTALVSLLASVLLALLFAHLLSRGFGRRISELTARCRDIAMGRPAQPIRARSGDEFDELAVAFNTMNEKLAESKGVADAAIADLETSRAQLEQRVEARTAEMNEAFERVQVLRGLLPICASCKKIRDDKGYWQQVELFVQRHAGTRFSHGICPECFVKQFGVDIEDVLDEPQI